MATIYTESDIDPDRIRGKTVAVLGYGSQGHAQALNLRDNGVEIIVGLHDGSASRATAEADGFRVEAVADATKGVDVVVFAVPDVPMGDIYCESVDANLTGSETLIFAHGFNVHYGLIKAPPHVNVTLVAPKGPGQRLRAEFLAGAGLPALVAVHRDATGDAKSIALAYAWGIGCARAGILETTFQEETETDLFGEQAVLCGGLSSLIKAGFDTLVDAGYQPEAAYFECLHETKLIVDLLYEGGLEYMRASISDTAEWGDYTAGPQVIGEASRAAMKQLLANIRSGEFAKDWIAENKAGRRRLEAFRKGESTLEIEAVGKRLRAMMPFVDDK